MTATKKPPRPATARGRGRAGNEAPRGEDESGRDTRSVGRPAAAGEPRDVVVKIRATQAEADRWRTQAERAGVPFSEWARKRLA